MLRWLPRLTRGIDTRAKEPKNMSPFQNKIGMCHLFLEKSFRMNIPQLIWTRISASNECELWWQSLAENNTNDVADIHQCCVPSHENSKWFSGSSLCAPLSLWQKTNSVTRPADEFSSACVSSPSIRHVRRQESLKRIISLSACVSTSFQFYLCLSWTRCDGIGMPKMSLNFIVIIGHTLWDKPTSLSAINK